jgi:hypothetical protein
VSRPPYARWLFLADDPVDLGWFWGVAGEPLAPWTGGDAFEDDGEPALPEVGGRAFRCANDWVDQEGYDGEVAGGYVWMEAAGGVRSCAGGAHSTSSVESEYPAGPDPVHEKSKGVTP